MTVENGLPSPVAERGRLLGRRHEIGEHDRSQDTIGRWKSPFAHDEVGDLCDDGIDVTAEGEMVCSVESGDLGVVQLLCHADDELGWDIKLPTRCNTSVVVVTSVRR